MGSSEGGRSPVAVSMADKARRWRVPEFMGIGVALTIATLAVSAMTEYKQFVPANNVEGVNGFPVWLGSDWCQAEDLSSCQSQPESHCCKELARGTQPSETFPTLLLWLVYFGVPITFIMLRHGLSKSGLYRGVGTLADVLLGLLFCLGTCVVLTDLIKKLVGRPRPNFFALEAMVQYGGTSMFSLEGKSRRSFPSGHSSESMAGTLYVTLVCWVDLSRHAVVRTGWRRSLFAFLATFPALISIWVGTTRVRDYWHFQDDVVAGWVIGGVCAAITVRWVTFPEAFWRGDVHGEDRLDVRSQPEDVSLQDRATLGLMMESTHGGRDGTNGSDASGDADHGTGNWSRIVTNDTMAGGSNVV